MFRLWFVIGLLAASALDFSYESEATEAIRAKKYALKAMRKKRAPVGSDFFGVDFECSANLKPEATVHQLRPSNVTLVGALGDSLTAASGGDAKNLLELIIEYRGLSWTAGGNEAYKTTLTLPNILKHFNPELKGFSVGTGSSPETSRFNVAVPGAKAKDLPGQAHRLIRRMKNDKSVSFKNDWKLITIFIGGNDLCALGKSEESQPKMYIKYLKETLDILHEELPRALVSVVEIFNISLLQEIGVGHGSSALCRFAQHLFCGYIATAKGQQLKDIEAKNMEYQQLTEDLIASGRYDTREDFTVVLQTFLKKATLPRVESGKVDSSYFAPDCFHFSAKGHAYFAMNLWNNMMEPVGKKSETTRLANLKCPSAVSPYIFTNGNSEL